MSCKEDIINTDVVLEIEDTKIKCNKNELSLHSDYFKAMFGGSFIESNKEVIQLKEIPLIPFQQILGLMSDPKFEVVDEQLLLLVLEISVKLQFNSVIEELTSRLKSILTVENCFELRMVAMQFGLSTFASDIKLFVLMHFEKIRKSSNFESLELNYLHEFLANRKLRCNSEYSVFQLCIKWWNAYCENNKSDSSFHEEAFGCFLSCLDFGSISLEELKQIMKYSKECNFKDNRIVNMLKYVKNMKKKKDINTEVLNSDEMKLFNWATQLHNSQSRYPLLFCVLLPSRSGLLVHRDHCSTELPLIEPSKYLSRHDFDIAYYDESTNNFVTFLTVKSAVWIGLCGFEIISYLETIFVVGGEFGYGRGLWSKTLWAYNYVTKKWTCTLMPFVRRNFLLVAGGGYLYIIGGTGGFRTNQYNMFWYNICEGKWSSLISLPLEETFKGGYCDDSLVLVNRSLSQLYFFDHNSNGWRTENMGKLAVPLDVLGMYSIFTFNNKMYIKGKYLIELDVESTKVIINMTPIRSNPDYEVGGSCITGSTLYSKYKTFFSNKNDCIIVEKYCIEFNQSKNLMKYSTIGDALQQEFIFNAFTLCDVWREEDVVNNFNYWYDNVRI